MNENKREAVAWRDSLLFSLHSLLIKVIQRQQRSFALLSGFRQSRNKTVF